MGLSIRTYLILGVKLQRADVPESILDEFDEDGKVDFDDSLQITIMSTNGYLCEEYVIGLVLCKLNDMDGTVHEIEISQVSEDIKSKVEKAIRSRMDIENVKLIFFHHYC